MTAVNMKKQKCVPKKENLNFEITQTRNKRNLKEFIKNNGLILKSQHKF